MELTTRTCSCGKVCKNQKGVRIHASKMGCPPIMNIVQRTRQIDETEEELGQDANHSAQSLQVLESLEGDSSNEDQQERDDKQEEPEVPPQEEPHEQQEPRKVRLK